MDGLLKQLGRLACPRGRGRSNGALGEVGENGHTLGGAQARTGGTKVQRSSLAAKDGFIQLTKLLNREKLITQFHTDIAVGYIPFNAHQPYSI